MSLSPSDAALLRELKKKKHRAKADARRQLALRVEREPNHPSIVELGRKWEKYKELDDAVEKATNARDRFYDKLKKDSKPVIRDVILEYVNKGLPQDDIAAILMGMSERVSDDPESLYFSVVDGLKREFNRDFSEDSESETEDSE